MQNLWLFPLNIINDNITDDNGHDKAKNKYSNNLQIQTVTPVSIT